MQDTAELTLVPVEAAIPGLAPARTRLGRLLERLGDRLNPILVKETRQALKSRQFLITFTLLLAAGWIWTILGVALIGPMIWISPCGPWMFNGYFFILSLPLLVIVPFGAFRSLAIEQEDRTYELLSITTLGPRQIIAGKLGSAAMQMIVYLSAISPCLGFTYLLRGIDFPTILLILVYTVLGSLALSMVCLLAGTLTAEKHWQVVLSVLLIAGLLFAWIVSMIWAWEGSGQNGVPINKPEFWQINAAFQTGYWSYFVLAFFAAAAQITFASDNRSTRLRVIMVLQHLLFVGWMAWVWTAVADGRMEVFLVGMSFLGAHWFIMGALMAGESPDLSPRVKRHLPQSFLGRVFLTWFNPGPGTGYMLAVASLGGVLVLVGIALVARIALISHRLLVPGSGRAVEADVILCYGTLGLAYIAFYLGLGLLLLRLLRKVVYVGPLLAGLIHVLLVLLGAFVPLVVQLLSPELRDAGYSLLHVSNVFWTLVHVADRTILPADAPALLVIVPLAALIVFAANLPGVVREVRHVRIARPMRVAEEDAAIEAEKSPPQPMHTSPWD